METDRLSRTDDRVELSNFLRSCRDRISPEQLGLPPTRRRRTKGLRREEVATLAGVGLTWYTWFEQGRDIQVSEDFLLRISRGLQLNRAEQEHLFALAQRKPIPPPSAATDVPKSLSAIIHRFPDAAYILDTCWDVVAFNEAALRLFPDLHGANPNLLHIVFFSDAYRQVVGNWNFVARLVFLRARHDFLTGGRSPILGAILDEIMEKEPEARSWWHDPEVLRIGDTTLEFQDPQTGWTTYHLSILAHEDHPNFRVVIYAPY